MWHCFTEDIGGNYLDFYAKLHNIDTKEAYKQILAQHGIGNEDQKEQERREKSYSVTQYAFEKRLPEEWLKADCKITTERDRKTGVTYMKIPYLDKDGREATFRKRYAHKDFRWKYGSGKQICLSEPDGCWTLYRRRAQIRPFMKANRSLRPMSPGRSPIIWSFIRNMDMR